MAERIRVAIVGGSLAGITLARGLLQYPHIRFDVFEVKSTFRERGAGVTLDNNAQSALRAMGLDSDAEFKAAGAVQMTSTVCLVGQGKHKGAKILELPGGSQTVARDFWLNQLLKPIPEEHLHANKRLKTVAEPEQPGGAYLLHFEDGTTFQADAVIGCDGVHGKIREMVLGGSHPDLVAPAFGGYWDARGRTTAEKALQAFGSDIFDPRSNVKVAIVVPRALMLFSTSNDGDVCHVLLAGVGEGPHFDKTVWKQPLSREFLFDYYKDLEPRFRDFAIDCLLADNSGPGVAFSEWESPDAPSYCRDRMCILGDAAHSMLPWMGQGACMTTEDVAVMAALLGATRSVSDLDVAMKAFDKTRRGRPENVKQASRKVAKLLTGQYGFDPTIVAKQDLAELWKPIYGLDMREHISSAVEYLNVFRK